MFVALVAALSLLAVSTAGGREVGSSPIAREAEVGCGTPYSLTEVPTSGAAPLLVSFSLSGPVSNSTSLSWTFGDGQELNGSGPDFAFAAHSYTTPGSYNASVTVEPTAPIARCSVAVLVRPGPLLVSFIASAYSGPAPLTIHLTGTVSGGTGDYRSELWSFGDGGQGSGFNVTYTFVNPGTFRIGLTVADSAGNQGEAEKEFTIGSPSTVPSPGGVVPAGPDLAGWAVLLGGIGFASAGIGYALYTRRQLAASAAGAPPAGPLGPTPPSAPP
ncbi:MAG: PKD domain-containing protein, partial [Thermoplasmata archaeon]|nr:PKD domain-containing protein [Thermoplasmata archaeon]